MMDRCLKVIRRELNGDGEMSETDGKALKGQEKALRVDGDTLKVDGWGSG